MPGSFSSHVYRGFFSGWLLTLIWRDQKAVAAKAQIRAFQAAIREFKTDTGRYPEGLQELREDPGLNGWRGPSLDAEVPNEWWGMPYLYRKDPATGMPEVRLQTRVNLAAIAAEQRREWWFRTSWIAAWGGLVGGVLLIRKTRTSGRP